MSRARGPRRRLCVRSLVAHRITRPSVACADARPRGRRSSTTRLRVGTLVARVALVARRHWSTVLTLNALAPGRVIAGLGTGDKLSKAEQVAYDTGYPSAEERWALLADALEAFVGHVRSLVRLGTSRDRRGRARSRRHRQPLGRDAWRACDGWRRAARSTGQDRSKATWQRHSINCETPEQRGPWPHRRLIAELAKWRRAA